MTVTSRALHSALVAALSVWGAFAPRPAGAHALAPSLLALHERAPGSFELTFRTPLLTARGVRLEPVLPAACTSDGAAEIANDGDARVERRLLRCGRGGRSGLTGATLAVRGLEAAGTDALVHVTFFDGRTFRAVLSPGAPRWTVPERESAARVFASYLGLGVAHLFGGIDHLLFVGGLLLVVRGRRRITLALTAFTLGHSLTLALATLGWVRARPAAIELGIAASLVLVALEAAGVHEGRRSTGASYGPAPSPGPIARSPWALCAGFGLLHGLGFAGALADVGLPGDAVPLALAGFNAGIEVAQLALAVGLTVCAVAWRSVPFVGGALEPARVAAHAIGATGIYLCLDRAVALF